MMEIVPAALSASPLGAFEPTICKRVEYGIGSLSKLPNILDMLGINKAFVVTGRSLATKTDVIEQVKRAAATEGKAQIVHVFHEIGQHVPIQNIRKGAKILRDADADGIIAVGGGSPIDAAKLLLSEHMKGTGKFLPMISIPTTLSAAETSNIAGYTNDDGKKIGIVGKDFTSSAIIYDAQLAMSTPLQIWLYTGIRAVDHTIEQQIRPDASIPVRALCRDAAGTLFESLLASKRNPDDVSARQRALIAAWMSLWPDNDRTGSLGLSHTIGYYLGAPYGIPHGMCSVLTLAPTIRIFAKHFTGGRLNSLAELLPFVDGQAALKLAEGNEVDRVLALADAVKRLCDELDLKPTLTEYKVPDRGLEGIARNSVDSFGPSFAPMYEDVVAALKGMY